MNTRIQIEKPCAENFLAMTYVEGGKFCDSCKTKVIDFTKMSLQEIENYFKNNSSQKICGRYNARHTSGSIFFTFLNRIENTVYKTRLRKLTVWSISIVFFLLNSYKCMGKRVERPTSKYDKKFTQADTLQNGSQHK